MFGRLGLRKPVGPLRGCEKGAVQRSFRALAEFSGRVWDKAGADDIFFLAGGISFNFLIAAIPFLLLLMAIFGYFLEATVADPQAAAVAYVRGILPGSEPVVRFVDQTVGDVVESRGGIGLVGVLLLIWVSTRVIGSLRSALRSVFNIREDRGIVRGKIFDLKMVIVAGTLFLANTAITIALEAAQTYGIQLLGLNENGEVMVLQALYAQLLAYGFIFLMFVLIYRYLPARRIPWRIAIVGATFTSVAFELLKAVFAWYVANIANRTSAYGSLTVVILLVFWIYYSAAVFVLGGVVGQVYELHRIRRRQRELLD
jgi:membrane protein